MSLTATVVGGFTRRARALSTINAIYVSARVNSKLAPHEFRWLELLLLDTVLSINIILTAEWLLGSPPTTAEADGDGGAAAAFQSALPHCQEVFCSPERGRRHLWKSG